MTIKIAYRFEDTPAGRLHIAEGVDRDGAQFSFRSQGQRYVNLDASTLALVHASSKRHVLHALIDEAIHHGVL